MICGRDVHPSECTALHAVSASFKMFKGDFVQLINGPCGTIKITADHETRSLKMEAIQTVLLSIISLMHIPKEEICNKQTLKVMILQNCSISLSFCIFPLN